MTLYQADFYAWTQQQAALLQAEEFTEVDWQNLIEEIEDMGNSQRDALESHLEVLLRHLLKLYCLPASNPSHKWRATVKEQRYRIGRLLKKNPSLRPLVPEMISDVYAEASDLAADDLATDDLAGSALPVYCLWTLEQILALDWLPS